MLVLLDLDGTLTDPYDGISRCVVHALERLGLPVPGEQALRDVVGPPLEEGFAGLGVPADLVGEAVALYRERFTVRGLYENRVYDGIPAALQVLQGRGDRLAVATSKPEPFAVRILEHFGLAESFVLVGGATLDGSRRHKADVVGHVLASLGETEAVMVGDRAQDVLGAAAHGLPCVGVSWGYARPGELAAAGARLVVDAPAELPDALAG